MRSHADMRTPLGAVVRGMLAGVAGTATMTAWQELSTRLQGSGGGSDGEPEGPWEQAPAPARVARKIAVGVFDVEPPAGRIGLITNAMHWAYGTGWGGAYGLLAGSAPRGRALRRGLAFGTAVWAASYAQLVPMGVYAPPWTYEPGELAMDLSYHLAYGAGVGAAHAVVR